MKTKIIHHLDYDCNVQMKEIRFIVNGKLEAIFFNHPNGMKKLFRKAPEVFESKEALEKSNSDFLKRTRSLIPKANPPLLLKRL